MKRYRQPLVHVISFLLWFNFQCRSKKPLVNCVNLGLTPDVKRAVSQLYAFLIASSMQEDSESEIDHTDLAKHVHRLLTALLTGQGPSCRKVDGAFDYALVLAMYAGDGNFHEPDYISPYCAMLQYCMRVIVVHIARVGGLQADYTLLPETDADILLEEQGEGEMDEPEENPLLPPPLVPLPDELNAIDSQLPNFDGILMDSGQMVIENPLLDFDEVEDPSDSIDPWKSMPSSAPEKFVNPMDIDEEEESTPTGDNELNNLRPDDLLTMLATYHKWISIKSDHGTGVQPTAFQRMKTVWLIIWPHAINTITKTQTQWDTEGQVLTYSDSRCAPHHIRLDNFRAFARSLVTDARNRLKELLPSKIDISELLGDVDLTLLKDNPATQHSFFEQNKGVFQPLIEDVFQSLVSQNEDAHKITTRAKHSKNKYRLDHLKKWFNKEQALLQAILCAYFFTCGISPRAFQAADFRFASSKGGKRNVFIMKGCLIFGWPRSKAFSKAVQAALWSPPPEFGQIVTVYLGVLRPVALRIAEDAELHPSCDSKHMVFANTFGVGPRTGVWSKEYISNLLRTCTVEPLGLALSPPRIRQIMSAIFRKHLSTLIDPTSRSSYQAHIRTSHANLQADHTQQTSNLHYGISLGPSSSLNLSDADVDQFIEVSQAWQAILGLIPGSRRILDCLYGVLQYKESMHMDFAHERVRSLICRQYNLGGDCKASRTIAERLLLSLPFIPSMRNNRLGDRVMEEIASIIIFGKGRPGISDAAPITGYSPLVITDAIALILLGIDEWRREEALEYNLQDLTVISAMDNIRRRILSLMETIEKEDPATWTELGIHIFRQAVARVPKATITKPLADLDFLDLMDVDDDASQAYL